MNASLGNIVALVTAALWSGTSILFTLASQRVGSQVVNRGRLLLAVGFLLLAHWLTLGTPIPLHAGLDRWGWLGLSAVVGLVIGDGLLFYAFTQIGPRLSMLLMALVPVMSTVLAWLWLGEMLRPLELLAIVITIGGIAWVVLERSTSAVEEERPRRYGVGVLCGVGAALGQAVGLVLSKTGMAGGFPPLSASLIRLITAAAAIWLLAVFQGELRSTLAGLRDRRALTLILGGALGGPAIGMSLSLVAVQLSAVGIASTLMALSPVLLLPLAYWVFHERITLRAVLGTALAMLGVAMIFLT